jgi:hypothetical protein
MVDEKAMSIMQQPVDRAEKTMAFLWEIRADRKPDSVMAIKYPHVMKRNIMPDWPLETSSSDLMAGSRGAMSILERKFR